MRSSLMFSTAVLIVPLFFGCQIAQESPDAVARAQAPRAQEPLTQVFKRVRPAVGVILTRGREVVPPALRTSRTFTNVSGLGSGVLIESPKKNLMLTAAHVVQTADRVRVQFESERKAIPATVISSSPSADVALLRLERAPAGVVPLTLADSDAVVVGERTFVVGAPYGLSHTLTVGYISARRKSETVLEGSSMLELFQTDAAINTGNSGGPLLTMRGEVIGIVSHILTRSGGFEGAGFAVTSNVAKSLLLDRPGIWSGVEALRLRGTLARIFNVPQSGGLLVQRVARNSPASRLGVRPGTIKIEIEGQEVLAGGDIVLAVAGVELKGDLTSYRKMRDAARKLGDDEALVVKILRGGKIRELERKKKDLLSGRRSGLFFGDR